MSTALSEVKPPVVAGASLIERMAAKYGLEPQKFRSTVIKTVFPSTHQEPSNEQLAAFLLVADQYNLNPFTREIYAFPGRNGGIVPIVSVDGWSTLINRQPENDGIDFDFHFDNDNFLVGCTTIIYRKDRVHPTKVTEYMAECKRNTDPWKSHPARMLRHKSLIQCARLAFGLSGIYDADEAERIAEAEQGQVTIGGAPQQSKTDRMAAQLASHPAVAGPVIDVRPETTETKTELKTETKPVDEKKEMKKVRDSIKALFTDEQIEKHTGGRDIHAIKSLDELNQLKDALTEDKD